MLKKFIMSLTSNGIVLLISILSTLIFPKFLSVEQYGYFQLFIFYSSYVGVLNFGICDGIYLLNAGKNFDELDSNNIKITMIILFVMEILISFIIIIIVNSVVSVDEIKIVWYNIALYSILYNIFIYVSYILQSTSKIKEYSIITATQKIVYLIFSIVSLFFYRINFEILIFFFNFGILIALIIGMFYCKELFLNKINLSLFNFNLFKSVINVGIKLLLANLAGMVITGIVRIGIQYGWDVSTFGKVSLSLSISNMFLVFINALGVVILPKIMNINKNTLLLSYDKIKTLTTVVMFILLLLFYPLKEVLLLWLPQYSDSLMYMSIIFPFCIFSCNYSLFTCNYYKRFRFEKQLLIFNIITLIISCVLTLIAVVCMHNLYITVINILIIAFIRYFICEIYFDIKCSINVTEELIWEVLLSITFVLLNMASNNTFFSLAIYLLIYLLFVTLSRKRICESIKFFLDYRKN